MAEWISHLIVADRILDSLADPDAAVKMRKYIPY